MDVEEAVRAARARFLESDDVPSPDGTPPGHDMQWPGTELLRSEWFADVQQSVIGRRLTMSARDYVGLLSTISAHLELPASGQERVYGRIMQVLPEIAEIAADITVHLALRRCEQQCLDNQMFAAGDGHLDMPRALVTEGSRIAGACIRTCR
ncbi:hypothetical protein U2F26_35200 [Micromonospora sp. 4G57]|uniref:DUF222 domain-containing protein n=1 Tax=Micromonospora sicca TaxID=2202420 RepID=A0ABU5JPT1_9ACTN|nr:MULTISPECIES: hypothetical protein [unclassified Micromonospora]MDZ5447884.1 hypothetical protein [Micromonospora sp. 4G57]MDZ5494630.1 hypothetical protein [Micromonospora sp. 4G53]